jgi:hypothetical protein
VEQELFSEDVQLDSSSLDDEPMSEAQQARQKALATALEHLRTEQEKTHAWLLENDGYQETTEFLVKRDEAGNVYEQLPAVLLRLRSRQAVTRLGKVYFMDQNGDIQVGKVSRRGANAASQPVPLEPDGLMRIAEIELIADSLRFARGE